MPTFFTDSASFNNVQVTGSTLLSGSGVVLRVIGSGSTIFSISGSSGEIFSISDSGSSTNLFSVSSGSTTILQIDSSKNVSISGSLVVTGSITGSLFGTSSFALTASSAPAYALKNTVVDTVAMLPPSLVDWVNMPAALTFFSGQTRWVIPCDLSNKTEVRLRVTMGSVGGSANAKLRLLYRSLASGYSTTIGDYLTVGTSEVQVTIGTTTNAVISTNWTPLVAGAQADVVLALAGIDGDGAADPRFLNVYVETR